MKLHFEPNLDYQLQAIEAVCGLFHGQETCRTEFTRGKEGVKIECGRAHFEALAADEPAARYLVTNSVAEMLSGL